ncbi:cytochrome P450 [Teratosphaeria nubilosa]|uniref:Cytochrome P450 n=1 Tax=Teratosphaeria nubilosa TaxID=161662 RepID=A0A6G1LHI2_9PEZI|nr:cytochrome P450 [Teratosphaeria nubilosa]
MWFAGATTIYNLYFHPLHKFPGPRAAAISEGWLYALSRSGTQEPTFEQLHKDYNTRALRIAPNELHITDVSLYKTIYSQSKPYPKNAAFYDAFNIKDTIFGGTDPAVHKERRRRLNPFFAKSGILKIERAIWEHVESLQRRLEALSSKGRPIMALNAFRCLTIDIISEFAFASAKGLVEGSDDNFYNKYLDTFDAAVVVIWDSMFNPTVRTIGNALPKFFISSISKEIGLMIKIQDEGKKSYEDYKTLAKSEAPVIFDCMNDLPDEPVAKEAIDILVAGSDTTAFTLATGVWHITRNPMIKQKLAQALREAVPNTSQAPSLIQLESIPYLMACIQESLRIAIAVPGRLPRVVPGGGADPLVVDGKVVPPGTIVGISAYTMHNDEETWGSDARQFNPERWLGEGGKSLASSLVTFSKGARNCIGQTLAIAELTFALFMVYRNFEVELDAVCANPLRTLDMFSQQIDGNGVVLRMKPVDTTRNAR